MSDHTLQLADSIAKSHYERDFYSHLSMLASVEFTFNPDLSKVGMESSFSGFKFESAPKSRFYFYVKRVKLRV